MKPVPEPPCGNDVFLEMLACAADERSADPSAVFEDAHLMADVSAYIKKQSGASFCILPFCHTLEAESYGADIRPGSRSFSPRPGAYRFSRMEELDELLDSDLSVPRIRETLAACRLLAERGESVLFQCSGPFTIMDSLLPSPVLFRSLRKQPDRTMELFSRIGWDSLRLMELAREAGAAIISYADPMGAPGILGPVLSRTVAKEVTKPLLLEAGRSLDPELLILLCPRTALSLITSGLAFWKEHPLPGPASYGEAALQMAGMVRFGGSLCPKRTCMVTAFHELILNKEPL